MPALLISTCPTTSCYALNMKACDCFPHDTVRKHSKPGPYNLHGGSFLHSFANKKLCLGLLLLFWHNMEVALCAQGVCHRAVLLLKQLNLQRKQDQFCDCVLRQKGSPGRLHPAHRCVLAASSPVLASIMSSTGVLVELQAPCMSDCVLEALVDYIYTRSLPHTQSQQQYHSLLTAASYLQMEELMEALQAWQHTERNSVDNADAPAEDESRTNLDIDTETVKSLTQYVPRREVNDKPNMNKEVQKDHSADNENPGILQRSAEDELVGMNEDRSASSLPHSCFGAVPVICHSSSLAILPMADVSTVPLDQPASRASLGPSRAPVLRSASSDNDCMKEDTTTDVKSHHGALNEMSQRQNVKEYHKDELNQRVAQDTCYESTADRSHQLKRDDNSRNECLDDWLAHDVSVYDFPSKYRREKRCESYSMSLRTATKEPSVDLRAAASLPQRKRDSHCEDFCPEGAVKQEHSYSSSCQAELDVQDSQCNLYGPKKKWLSTSCWAETSIKDAAAIQHENVSEDVHTAAENRGTTLFCMPASTTPGSSPDNIPGQPFFERRTSVEPEKTMAEPGLTFTMSVDSSMSDSVCGEVSQLYSGHVHYHCLTEEDPHCDHTRSQHHSHHSDRSGDEEGSATLAGSSHNPDTHCFAAESAERFLLLDISTKPAELLVSYRHTSDREEEEEEEGVESQRERFESRQANIESGGPGAEVGCPGEAERQIGTWTVCSPPSVSDSEQAPIPSTSSVGMPSSLSANMPTTISTHLSTLVNHPFQCTLCDRSFSQRGSLNRHVRSHLGVRPFPCPRCPMTFSRQYRVTEHMRVHQRCVLRNDFQNPPNSMA